MSCNVTYEDDTVKIDNAEELFIAFNLTPPEADMDILNQVGTGITDLIKTDTEFLMLLQKVLGMKGQSKKPFLTAFKDNLPRVVTKGKTLGPALAMMANADDQKTFLEMMRRDGILNCISSIETIADCLEWLHGSMDLFFIELIGWEYLSKYIHDGESLGIILRYLDSKEEGVLLDKMGWDKVLDCIQTPNDLFYILNGMETINEKKLIDHLDRDKIMQILPFKEQLEEVCTTKLTPEDAKILRAKYQEK